MTKDDNIEKRDDKSLAAEYALHLLSPDERAAFEARLVDDAALRDLVREWDSHFVGFADEIEHVKPPAPTKNAINDRLFENTTAPKRGANFMRWLLGASATAAVIAVAIWILPSQFDPLDDFNPTHVAEVSAEDQSLVIRAEFAADDDAFIVTRVAGMPDEGRDYEMWLIPEGADAPISLGVIPEGDEVRVEIAPELRMRLASAAFAISDEPKGGSPTGLPTGDVLAAGAIQTL